MELAAEPENKLSWLKTIKKEALEDLSISLWQLAFVREAKSEVEIHSRQVVKFRTSKKAVAKEAEEASISDLGKQLREIRQKYIKNGGKMLSNKELDVELASRRLKFDKANEA